jgi:hypothetical protein
MFRTAANGANWNPSVIRYALRRHYCYEMKNLRHRETMIPRCCAKSIHRRCCHATAAVV